jgi:hypothetical protein
MHYKRFIIIFSAVLIIGTLLIGCGNSSVIQETPTALPNIDPKIKIIIDKLQSLEPIQKGEAASELAGITRREMEDSSRGLFGNTNLEPVQIKVEPAIPYLINILNDESPLEWSGTIGGDTSPAKEAVRAFGEIGRPAVEPLLIALEDSSTRTRAAEALYKMTGAWAGPGGQLGQDPVLWREWWEKNKSKPVMSNEKGLLSPLLSPWCNIPIILIAIVIAYKIIKEKRKTELAKSAHR